MICHNCKKEIYETSKFCRFCGAKNISFHTHNEDTGRINFKDYVAYSDKRLINSVVDSSIGSGVFVFIVFIMVGFITELLGLSDSLDWESGLENLLIYLVAYLYYFLFELTTGKTLGKYLTKTRVVNEDGSKPDFGTILKRTLIRIIPFEALSFLRHYPIGWHDKWSGTLVVDEKKMRADGIIS